MSTSAPNAARGPTPWLALLSIALGASLAPLDSSVNAAFPSIISHFARPIADIRWVIIVYVLTFASLPLVFGRAGDLFGHRRIFILGLAWCAIAHLGCSLASQFHWLLFARINQGVGTALILATAPALITLTLPVEQRTRGIALYTLAFASSQTLGPLVGGALVQSFGWPAVFWMRIPIALVAIVMTFALVPAPVKSHINPDNASSKANALDPLTGLALAFGLAATLLFLGQGGHFGWTSPTTMMLAVTGVTLLWLFCHRQHDPNRRIIDLALFRDRAFTVANLSNTLLNASFFMVMLLVPFYLQRAHGDGAVMLLTLSPLGFALGSPLAERAMKHFSAHRVCVFALATCALTLGAIALWPERAPIAWVAAVLLLVGIGYGLFQVAVLDQVMGHLSRDNQGVAGSLHTVTRTTGVVLGASAGSALFDALEINGFINAFSTVFQAACALALVNLALMVVFGRGTAQRPTG
jgi:EmrB/QacA subfamily drug resistance transporter